MNLQSIALFLLFFCLFAGAGHFVSILVARETERMERIKEMAQNYAQLDPRSLLEIRRRLLARAIDAHPDDIVHDRLHAIDTVIRHRAKNITS